MLTKSTPIVGMKLSVKTSSYKGVLAILLNDSEYLLEFVTYSESEQER